MIHKHESAMNHGPSSVRSAESLELSCLAHLHDHVRAAHKLSIDVELETGNRSANGGGGQLDAASFTHLLRLIPSTQSSCDFVVCGGRRYEGGDNKVLWPWKPQELQQPRGMAVVCMEGGGSGLHGR